jgi:hypothetical protein
MQREEASPRRGQRTQEQRRVVATPTPRKAQGRSPDLIDALPISLFSLSSSLGQRQGLRREADGNSQSARHSRAGSYGAVGLTYDPLVPIKADHLAVKPRADLDGVFLKQRCRNELVTLCEQFARI